MSVLYDIKLAWQVQWHVAGCFADVYEHFPKPHWRDVLLHVSLSQRLVRVLITAAAYVEVINLAEQDSITGKWKQTAGLWQFGNLGWKHSSSTQFFFNLSLNFAFLLLAWRDSSSWEGNSVKIYIVLDWLNFSKMNWNVSNWCCYFRADCQYWFPADRLDSDSQLLDSVRFQLILFRFICIYMAYTLRINNFV